MKKLLSVILALTVALCAFTPAFAEGGAFADVEQGRWYTEGIERAFSEGVITGSGFDESGARLFNPTGTLTYAQFTAILARKFFPEDMAATEFPEDIAAEIGSANLGRWWAPAYYTCVKNSLLLKDITAADFSTKPIPRKEMAFMVYSVAGLLGHEIKVTDAEIEAVPDHVYAAEGETLATASVYMIVIAACYKLGIINGVDTAGNFSPNTYVNRAQAATIYCRAVDAFDKLEADKARQTEFAALSEEVLALVNEERAAEDLKPLVFDDTLQKAAEVRAQEQLQSFAHTRPDGTSFTTAIDNSGHKFSSAGENLAAGSNSAAAAMKGWMESEGHRANIMNAKYDAIGIAVSYDEENDRYYWCQIFGKYAEH